MKSTKKQPYFPRVIRLMWIDAQSANIGLFTVEEIKDLAPCKAEIVGFLVKEDKDNYFLAAEHWEETDQFKYLHIIPKAYVKDKEFLEVKLK